MSLNIQITKKTEKELDDLGIHQWSIWTCEKSEFPWTYAEKESCYIIEGVIDVIVEDKTYHIEPGDYVIFPEGLSCFWKVISPVKKYYSFG